MSGLSHLIEQARKAGALKPGWKTTEFWGKTLVQVVLGANSLVNFGIAIDDATAWLTIGALEAIYLINRLTIKTRNS